MLFNIIKQYFTKMLLSYICITLLGSKKLPGPWLVRFFQVWQKFARAKSAALRLIVVTQKKSFAYVLKTASAGYLAYSLKMCKNENCTTEIRRSHGPGVLHKYFWNNQNLFSVYIQNFLGYSQVPNKRVHLFTWHLRVQLNVLENICWMFSRIFFKFFTQNY